ncbi:class II aldolase/adducin family protein [Jiella endophytica]|uniref:Class II aldolase/adducin family protein n=1 Tax=Jiella endophytica TaxID=2558362 RepID=A0A4Y8RJ85_9HYPH|nr:class II aldolase/adducin family protein [Jiella endophytica]TFF23108.1 class II aldolase/adducin family protein [Jiella endophytica]
MRQTSSSVRDLVLANHILAHEGVLDAFGHVSVRDPEHAGNYLLARARSPEVVEEADILRFTLDSVPVDPDGPPSYSERVIHGSLYQLRPEIGAVCHFHAAAIMPFCITGKPILPVSHLCATVGPVHFWSSRDDFGDTNLIVGKPEEGDSLARAMQNDWAVLMANHGAVVAGRSLKEMVFRTIQLRRNAAMLLAAQSLGPVDPLTERETVLSAEFNLREPVLDRAWDYWSRRAGGAERAAAHELASAS